MFKKILYFSWSLWFVSIIQIHAQSYIPMIDDSLYWDVAYAVNDPNPCAGFGVGGPDRYFIGGDTTINGVDYKQILGYNFQTFTPAPCPPFYVDTVSQSFDFYIREDTIGMKVYRYNTSSQLDELQFDYSLQQNDSIYLPGSTNIYFYVDTLYSIITSDGVTRKYFECFPRPNQGTTGGYYIEGLGGAMGPFERPYHLFEEGYWVLCISDLNESPIFPAAASCFTFTTSLMQQESSTEGLTINPIPTSESITIRNVSLNSSFIIYDMFGEEVERNKLSHGHTINISRYKAGIYLIILQSDKIISAAKFIKQ